MQMSNSQTSNNYFKYLLLTMKVFLLLQDILPNFDEGFMIEEE